MPAHGFAHVAGHNGHVCNREMGCWPFCWPQDFGTDGFSTISHIVTRNMRFRPWHHQYRTFVRRKFILAVATRRGAVRV